MKLQKMKKVMKAKGLEKANQSQGATPWRLMMPWVLRVPDISTTVNLGPTSFRQYAAGQLQANVSFRDGNIRCEDLVAEGLTPGRDEAVSRVSG